MYFIMLRESFLMSLDKKLQYLKVLLCLLQEYLSVLQYECKTNIEKWEVDECL